MTYSNLYHIITSMIVFVTWPPKLHLGMKKGGRVTKPIILVKICYKLLYVIQGVENSVGKVTSWPQLISEFWSHMPVNNVASDWPHTFLCPRCFCLAYHYFCKQISLLCGSI